jgi:Spy/CpxP family protein refolding chaperone
MSIRNKLTGVVLSLALIATFGIATYAQQATTTDKATPQAQTGAEQRGERRHRGMPMLRLMHDLNLTDAQKEQARAVIQRFRTSIEPQRQALRELRRQTEPGTVSDEVRERARALRGEIRESMMAAHGELLTILTTEQRAQYDQKVLQWKARREERRARHAERKVADPEKAPAQ